MEYVFILLRFDAPRNRTHHINRDWIQQFRRWARVPTFRRFWTNLMANAPVGGELLIRPATTDAARSGDPRSANPRITTARSSGACGPITGGCGDSTAMFYRFRPTKGPTPVTGVLEGDGALSRPAATLRGTRGSLRVTGFSIKWGHSSCWTRRDLDENNSGCSPAPRAWRGPQLGCCRWIGTCPTRRRHCSVVTRGDRYSGARCSLSLVQFRGWFG